MAETPYLVLGHGIEEVMDPADSPFGVKRMQLPEGVVLVTFSECGVLTGESSVCSIFNLFLDPTVGHLLSDPIGNKLVLEERLGQSIRIYGPGSLAPMFAIQYFANHPSSGLISKSGVYKYPIDPDRCIPVEKQNTSPRRKCPSLMWKETVTKNETINPDLIQAVFEQSIYPPIQVDPAMTYGDFQAKVTLEFADLFNKPQLLTKPCVIYYPICRAPFKRTLRTIFGRNPGIGTSLPAAVNVKDIQKVLSLDKTFLSDDESIYYGDKLIQFMELHPERVPQELLELFQSIEPINSLNALETFRNVEAKIALVRQFPVDLIQDPDLRTHFQEYLKNFEGWRYIDTRPYISSMERIRRASANQQAKIQGRGGVQGGRRNRTRRLRKKKQGVTKKRRGLKRSIGMYRRRH